MKQEQASIETANNLRTIANELSQLTLPEIDEAVEAVAKVVPAGNIPGLILSGLSRLPGRKPPVDTLKRDVGMLFKGVEQVLDKAVFSAFFAGPAAVIWGYQNLLKLAGKDPNDSFPEGTWQFYVDYALRDDTARHSNETYGFDSILIQNQITLSQIDRVTAWIMTSIQTIHQYHALLENKWREQVYIRQLIHTTRNTSFENDLTNLYQKWQSVIPYGRKHDSASSESYPDYRKRKFDQFIEDILNQLPHNLLQIWSDTIQAEKNKHLPKYQQQMSILCYLKAGAYGEERISVPLNKLSIGLIHDRKYHLIPVCQPQTNTPPSIDIVRSQVATIFMTPQNYSSDSLIPLAKVRRSELPNLYKKFQADLTHNLNKLRSVPIIFNSDQQSSKLTLAEIRQSERGIGDHALTIFDTKETIVFDQSHIFFDGGWGAELAEIMTNEALSWAVYLHQLPEATLAKRRPYSPVFQVSQSDQITINKAAKVAHEVSVETTIAIKPLLNLRKFFKQRSDLIQLTVNDLLILYRAIHAVTYKLDQNLIEQLERLSLSPDEFVDNSNPPILIPVDASQRSPRERLYPMSFQVPLKELDFINLHNGVMGHLTAYKNGGQDRDQEYSQFDKLQRIYLATLAGFGAVMSKAKEIANAGESASVGTIKLLAQMPIPLQRMLDSVPNKFDVLNDIIKGREVFSNVGAVARSSTLRRFITAKDDNEKKTLAWGIVTDAKGNMHISLRDFRPYVAKLVDMGQYELSRQLAQHYLNTYASGLNQYIDDLKEITITSRETRVLK